MLLHALMLLAAVSAPAPARDAVVVHMDFVKFPERMTSYLPMGIAYLDKAADPPPGEWKLPAFQSRVPIFSRIRLGDENRLLVLDRKKGREGFYDRVWFDADGDGDLTDDPPIDGKAAERGNGFFFTQFPSVDTTITVDGEKTPYSFRLRLYGRGKTAKLTAPGKKAGTLAGTAGGRTSDSSPDRAADAEGPSAEEIIGSTTFYLTSNCVLEGKLALGDETYRVILGDNDADGRFGESYAPPAPGKARVRNDTLFITTKDKVSYQDGMEIGGLLGIGERLFRVAIDAPGRKFTLLPATKNLGKVKLPMAVERIFLAAAEGGESAMFLDPGTAVALPAGRYRLGGYLALREDDGGNAWRLKAAAQPGTSSTIAVAAGKKTALPFGEPFTPSVAARPLSGSGGGDGGAGDLRLSFSLLGTGRERVTDLRSLTNEKSGAARSSKRTMSPLEPHYTITPATGGKAAEGNFQYG